MKRGWLASLSILVVVAASSCTVGPRYQRASVPTPPAWKTEPPWRVADPKDGIPKGKWWTIFGDSVLNGYEDQAYAANQTIAAAAARLQQARALARVSLSSFYLQSENNTAAQRQRLSENRPTSGGSPATSPVTQNVFTVPFALNYEPDLFGKNRRDLESSNASLQAAAADLENARLVVTAELAADYFTLRELDAEIAVVQEALSYQQRGLDLVEARNRGGVASGLDVAQQRTVLESTRTQLQLLQLQRSRTEHAIAVLMGEPASTFGIPVGTLSAHLPEIPPGVPSDILERRPDVASAERQMAAANARIGVALSAFYPGITLGGQVGLQSTQITNLVTAPSALWALGSGLAQSLLSGGRNRAQADLATAQYDTVVANYRNDVLTAFQQVEDALSGLQNLSLAAESQQRAVEAARQALEIANNRYVGGLVTYLDVITAQENLLNNQRLATQILGQQLVTSVLLVKALGGGWDSSTLNSEPVHAKASDAIQR